MRSRRRMPSGYNVPRYALSGVDIGCATPCPVNLSDCEARTPMALRLRYAKPSTDLGDVLYQELAEAVDSACSYDAEEVSPTDCPVLT
eukprot:238900-Rhodomonas_salina.2